MGKRVRVPYLLLKNPVSCADSYETMWYIRASEVRAAPSGSVATGASGAGADKKPDSEFKSRKARVVCTRRKSKFAERVEPFRVPGVR